jgi:hypothetical protein
MTMELDTSNLSHRAKKALTILFKGEPVTAEHLGKIDQRNIWIMPGFGRKTSNEIKAWAASYGIAMPERNS